MRITLPDCGSIASDSARPSLVATASKKLRDLIWMFENPAAASLSRISCSVTGPDPRLKLSLGNSAAAYREAAAIIVSPAKPVAATSRFFIVQSPLCARAAPG
jgi:hypothetical protein